MNIPAKDRKELQKRFNKKDRKELQKNKNELERFLLNFFFSDKCRIYNCNGITLEQEKKQLYQLINTLDFYYELINLTSSKQIPPPACFKAFHRFFYRY